MKIRKLKKLLKRSYFIQFEKETLYASENYKRKFWEKNHKKRSKPIKKFSYIIEGGLDYWGEVEEWFLWNNQHLKEYVKNNKIYKIEME